MNNSIVSQPLYRIFTAVEQALEHSRLALRQAGESALAKQLLEKLTPREKQTLRHLLTGQLNKQIAADLGISETTVKIHRSRVMHKMRVHSVTDLVRLVEKADSPPTGRRRRPVPAPRSPKYNTKVL